MKKSTTKQMLIKYTIIVYRCAVTKPGTCPRFPIPKTLVKCMKPVDKCHNDADCPGDLKCCRVHFCGGLVCVRPVIPGMCLPVTTVVYSTYMSAAPSKCRRPARVIVFWFVPDGNKVVTIPSVGRDEK